MKYFGGVLVLAYAALHVLHMDRLPGDDRGELPPSVRSAPGGILSWHDGFMGGK